MDYWVFPASVIQEPHDGGYFEKGGKKMIISRGLGMHTIHMRLFNPGELVVVSLKK